MQRIVHVCATKIATTDEEVERYEIEASQLQIKLGKAGWSISIESATEWEGPSVETAHKRAKDQ